MSKSDSHFQNAYFPISSSPLPRVTDAQILVFVERPILERHYGRMEFDASRIRRDHFALLPPMIDVTVMTLLIAADGRGGVRQLHVWVYGL